MIDEKDYTPWFHNDHPARHGVYEVLRDSGLVGVALWSVFGWMDVNATLAVRVRAWRGLTLEAAHRCAINAIQKAAMNQSYYRSRLESMEQSFNSALGAGKKNEARVQELQTGCVRSLSMLAALAESLEGPARDKVELAEEALKAAMFPPLKR